MLELTALVFLCLAPAQADKSPFVRLEGHKHNVLDVAISKDASQAYSIDKKGVLILWDLKNAKQSISRELGPLHNAAFSPDATRLALGLDGRISIIDPQTGKEVAGLAVVKGLEYDDLALSLDGKRLLIAYDYGQVDVWDLSGTEPERLFKEDLSPERVFLSHDGTMLLPIDGHGASATIRIERDKKPASLPLTKGGAGAKSLSLAAYTPDGKEIVAITENKVLAIRDSATGKELTKVGKKAEWDYSAVAISGDGKTLVANDRFAALLIGRRKAIGEAWTFTHRQLEIFPLVAEHRERMALSRTGAMAVLSLNKAVLVYKEVKGD